MTDQIHHHHSNNTRNNWRLKSLQREPPIEKLFRDMAMHLLMCLLSLPVTLFHHAFTSHQLANLLLYMKAGILTGVVIVVFLTMDLSHWHFVPSELVQIEKLRSVQKVYRQKQYTQIIQSMLLNNMKAAV